MLPLAGSCAIGASAWAQWTAIPLHNPGFVNGSSGHAAWGDWQGGGFGATKPVIWHSSSREWINLAPGVEVDGMVLGMHGDRQVGQVNGHASLWAGTPESRIDLHPAWAELSVASAVWGDEQVGWAGTTVERAALWHGSAASYVDLHPPGATRSMAAAVAGGQQGGAVVYGTNISHAALWSGSPGSFVDLNPPGALSSGITGMWPGQQVGGATFPGIGGKKVGYWSGTPESFVSLQPPNASFVSIFGTCGTAQVGRAALPIHSAVIWFGTAESMINLHDLLPAGQYFQSEALAVSSHNGQYYVTGTAWTTAGHGLEAWLWVGVPAPAAPLVFVGALALAMRRCRPVAGDSRV